MEHFLEGIALLRVYTFKILCEEAKKILNSLQRNEEIAKENFTYENHLKVSRFCSPELEL